jgi:hypothetical protein
MRYIPSTDRAISIDEIAAQCKAAILKADEQRREQQEFDATMQQIADLLFDDRIYWQDDQLICA